MWRLILVSLDTGSGEPMYRQTLSDMVHIQYMGNDTLGDRLRLSAPDALPMLIMILGRLYSPVCTNLYILVLLVEVTGL
jgi:hypothetical protein